MPLDTGALADGPRIDAEQLRRPRLTLDSSLDIGAALRAARGSLGLSLEEISADDPRARARTWRRSRAVRLDAAAVAAVHRSATSAPTPRRWASTPMRPPPASARSIQVRTTRSCARRSAFATRPIAHPQRPDRCGGRRRASRPSWAGTSVQRVMAAPTAGPAAVAPRPCRRRAQANTAVGRSLQSAAPLPAPPEATAPAPYVTPWSARDATNAVKPAAPIADAGAPSTPQGDVYGAAAGASSLIIQANKSISLEVRGPGGAVYFARQLDAGEAYRVPALPGLPPRSPTRPSASSSTAWRLEDGLSSRGANRRWRPSRLGRRASGGARRARLS